ncbi:hypothetical protein SEA_LUCKYSOCKE_216 [Streptomyces phage LuckySocke]|jgi:mannose/fructose-specific phosphotransferase system component IIA|nr:hypothetical protein SEA_LUCKYSOCKE_216 [Streptomyces phage LuckySocke]
MSEKRKGGRVKATWWGSIRRVARTLVHHYEGNVCTGMSQRVLITLELEREPGRMVCVKLTAEDARKWSDALNHFADKVERGEW